MRRLFWIAAFAAGCLTAQSPTTPVITAQTPFGYVIPPGQTVLVSVLVASRAGAPQAGATVFFTAPDQGPSGTFAGASTAAPYSVSAVTAGNGMATASFTAGPATGYFAVSAHATGIPSTASFAFTVQTQAPPPVAGLTAVRAAVLQQLLNNATLDETLQLHGPFLLAPGLEVHPGFGGNPQLFVPSLPVKTLSWLLWIDNAPLAGFQHSTAFVLVDATQASATQAVASATVLNEVSWPEILAPDLTLNSLALPVAPGVPSSFHAAAIHRLDAPADACAIIVTGPELNGTAQDVANFQNYLSTNSLVPAGNTFSVQTADGAVAPTTPDQLNSLVAAAVKKGCKTVYIFISAHGGASDNPSNAGLLLAHGVVPYSDLPTIFGPLKSATLHFFENSCYSGLVAQALQGQGFTGDIVTSADTQHQSYQGPDNGSYFMFQYFDYLENFPTATPQQAIQTIIQDANDPKVTASNPGFTVINPTGTRNLPIAPVTMNDTGQTQPVKIFRPTGVTGALTIALSGPGSIGTFDKTSVTMNATDNVVTVNATSAAAGSGTWSVSFTDATGQAYSGSNIFQVGQFAPTAPEITVEVGKTATETITRYGPNISRGDPVLNGTADSYTVTSGNAAVATPAATPVAVKTTDTNISVTVTGVSIGTTTFTVKNRAGKMTTFKVQVVAKTSSAGGVCPNGALWDTTVFVVSNPANHPIQPGDGKWMFNSTASSFTLTGPAIGSQPGVNVTGTIDGSCHFSGSAPYDVFGYNTRVDVTNGMFVNAGGSSNSAQVSTSNFAGIQFQYAIGQDGNLPTGQAISFLAEGIYLCSYSVLPTPLNFTGGGGSDVFSVVTEPPCPWTPTPSAPWITIGARTPAGSGNGGGSFAFTVAPNTTSAARTATITVAGAFAGTVNQAAGGANRPVITQAIDGAKYFSGFTSGAFLTLTGSHLAIDTRQWQASDFNGNLLPTSLDGTSVTVNGQTAFVEAIDSSYITVIAPADTATGPLAIQVTTTAGVSDLFFTDRASLDPALFIWPPLGGIYPIGGHLDGTLLGPAALYNGAPATTPASANETIVLYGTGFGDTNPLTPFNQVVPATPTAARVVAWIGGLPAQVIYAGLVGPGLYQLNITVPNLPPGDQPVQIYVDGVPIQPTVYITVGG
jgi:uncharacterized protein (TIGR03437 family)